MKSTTILGADSVLFSDSSGDEVQMLHPGIHPGLTLFEEIAEQGFPTAATRSATSPRRR
jgi:hypothetical protein